MWFTCQHVETRWNTRVFRIEYANYITTLIRICMYVVYTVCSIYTYNVWSYCIEKKITHAVFTKGNLVVKNMIVRRLFLNDIYSNDIFSCDIYSRQTFILTTFIPSDIYSQWHLFLMTFIPIDIYSQWHLFLATFIPKTFIPKNGNKCH